MKKFIILGVSVLAIAGVIVAAGLLGGGTEQEVMAYSDTGETIEINADGEFIIEIALDSNPSTGYTWVATYDETKLELVSDTYESDATDVLVVGAGGTQYFYFKALQSGEVTITMDYMRSWETESIDQKVFTVNID